MGTRPNRLREAIRRQPWLWLLGGLFLLSAVLLLAFRANIGFFLDDWYLVLLRDGASDWMLPHNQHIIILPAAIYELSLSLFGMHALPLHLLALTLFLTSILLLFFWMRPLIGDPASVIGCAIMLFLGAATGDLIFAFQIGFFGSVVGGLGALILLRRDTARADIAACLLLVISMLCSTLMAPFFVAVAVQLLYRKGSRAELSAALRDSWIVLIPFVLYLVWSLGWNQDGSHYVTLENALKAPLYLLSALGFSAASLTGLFPLRAVIDNFFWAIPGLIVAAGFVQVLRRRGSVPPEFLIGLAAAVAFWLLCALNYTAAREFFTSRYQYPSVLFLLMMLVGAFRGLRPDSRQLRWLGAFAALSIVINVAAIFYAFNETYKPYEERNLVNLAAVDITSRTVDPDFMVGVGTGAGAQVTAGEYLSAADRYGRPEGVNEDTLTNASESNREMLDRLLVFALPVEVVPGDRVAPIRDSCRKLEAEADGSPAIDLPSSLNYIAAEEGVQIRLGRYADEAEAIAWGAPAGRPIGYFVPKDNSERPWRISFRGQGEVKICAARPSRRDILKNS